MALLRLGSNSCDFHTGPGPSLCLSVSLCLLDHLLWGKQALLWAALWIGPHGKEMKFPPNSQWITEAYQQPGGLTWSGPWAFRWLQSWLTARLWFQEWLWDRIPRRTASSLFFLRNYLGKYTAIQFSSVAQLSPTLCDSIDCSMPGLPVHHHNPEFTQTHVHWFGVAVQTSHPLSSPFPLAFNLSQHQGLQMSQLFTSGGQSIGVSGSTSVLPMNTQDWSPLGWTGWISLQSKGLLRVFSNTKVQMHQFFGARLSS